MKRKHKLALNGFGRIGRAFTRIAFSSENDFEIVAINTRKSTSEIMAYLLKYDSVYRTYNKKVAYGDDYIEIEGSKIICSNIDAPDSLHWGDLGIDVALDCSGAFRDREGLSGHLQSGAKQVVLSSPSKDQSIPHVVLGVNDESFDFSSEIISNASCTTNCVAPIYRFLHEEFGIKDSFFTTNHAYTSSQALLDEAGKNFARSRAANLSIIPTSTGAATAVSRVIPALEGKVQGAALRVPVPSGSLASIYANLDKPITRDELHSRLLDFSKRITHGVLSLEATPLVSSDFVASTFSAVVDTNQTQVFDSFVSISAWYDNEWGYSSRLVDLMNKIANHN